METPEDLRRMSLRKVGDGLVSAGGQTSQRGALFHAELLRRQAEALVRYTLLTGVIAAATVATAIATWLLLLD